MDTSLRDIKFLPHMTFFQWVEKEIHLLEYEFAWRVVYVQLGRMNDKCKLPVRTRRKNLAYHCFTYTSPYWKQYKNRLCILFEMLYKLLNIHDWGHAFWKDENIEISILLWPGNKHTQNACSNYIYIYILIYSTTSTV